MRPRWDIDERGHGVGDAKSLVPAAQELLARMEEPLWVAEQPDAHLLPHIRRMCERDDFPVELVETTIDDDGTLALDLKLSGEWNAGSASVAAFALLGQIAEQASFVRMDQGPDWLQLDAVTGMVSADGPFAPHGHTLRLRVSA